MTKNWRTRDCHLEMNLITKTHQSTLCQEEIHAWQKTAFDLTHIYWFPVRLVKSSVQKDDWYKLSNKYLKNTRLENLTRISTGSSAVSWLNESALFCSVDPNPKLTYINSAAISWLDFETDKYRTQNTFLQHQFAMKRPASPSPLLIQIQAALKLTAEASWRGGGSFKSTGLLKILTWKNTF